MCHRSKEERRTGQAPDGNRVYIGEDYPDDVKKREMKLKGWGIKKVKCLHGKLGGKVRKDALKDLDVFTAPADVFVVTNVAGIGTDQNCKYKAGFLKLRCGDHAPGPRAAGQKLGRLNRNRDKPLDEYTAPDGTWYQHGVIFVLLPGLPPAPSASAPAGDPQDRAANKLRPMRDNVDNRRSSVRSTHGASTGRQSRP